MACRDSIFTTELIDKELIRGINVNSSDGRNISSEVLVFAICKYKQSNCDWIFMPLKTEQKQLPAAELAGNFTQQCELSFAFHHDLGVVHGHRESAEPSPELKITWNFTTCKTWVSVRLSIDCANRGARKKLGFVGNLIASHWAIFYKYQQWHERWNRLPRLVHSSFSRSLIRTSLRCIFMCVPPSKAIVNLYGYSTRSNNECEDKQLLATGLSRWDEKTFLERHYDGVKCVVISRSSSTRRWTSATRTVACVIYHKCSDGDGQSSSFELYWGRRSMPNFFFFLTYNQTS